LYNGHQAEYNNYGKQETYKTLGLSQLVYATSMLRVPEMVIKRVQEKINFLWKNKNDKIKRSVIYQSLSSGGINFPNFRTVVKSLRLSWLGRFLNRTNESCKQSQMSPLTDMEGYLFY